MLDCVKCMFDRRGVLPSTLMSRMHAAGQEKVWSAETNPDVTLNKVINKEQGYIEWNYTFNAAKDRDSSSGYYWFMLPEVEQVGLPYDWQINTYKHQIRQLTL